MEKVTTFVFYSQRMEKVIPSLVLVLKQATELAITVVQVLLDGRPGSQLAAEALEAHHGDLAFICLDGESSDQAEHLIQSCGGVPVIGVIDEVSRCDAISLLRCGFADFIIPPFRAIDVIPRVLRLISKDGADEEPLVQSLKGKLGLKHLIGESEAFVSEVGKIPLVASCDATVLILGETGTGKELFARAVHYLSPRHGKPFVPFNCGGVPADLIENELFGHLKGAFTGAYLTHGGLVSEAEGGSLFLDEIDSLPQAAQAKFLRFLQSKEYRQLGSRTTQLANVRVIAASNANLHQEVKDGKFRRDLFYRLNVVPLHLPALRERTADISLLAHHFLKKYASQFTRPQKRFAPDALRLLHCHNWPGNVRELESVIERAVIFGEGPFVRASDIMIEEYKEVRPLSSSLKAAKAKAVAQIERAYLEEALRANQGNITKAAQHVQMNRRVFWELLRKHKINLQGP